MTVAGDLLMSLRKHFAHQTVEWMRVFPAAPRLSP